MKLRSDDEVAGVLSINEDEKILILTEYGYGKRIDYQLFQPHGTRTKGQIAYKTSEKTGEIIGVINVSDNDELMCISSQGSTIKLDVENISQQGKNASGVRVLNIVKPDFLISLAKIKKEQE